MEGIFMKKIIQLFSLGAMIIASLPAHASIPASFNPKNWTVGSEQQWNNIKVAVQDIKTSVAQTDFGVESITEYSLFVPDAERLATLKVTVSEDKLEELETFTYQDSNSWGKTFGKILAATAILGFWAFKVYTK
jgi:hypothetical protein